MDVPQKIWRRCPPANKTKWTMILNTSTISCFLMKWLKMSCLQVTTDSCFCGNTASALGTFCQICQDSSMLRVFLFILIHSSSLLRDNFPWGLHFSSCLSNEELTALGSGSFSSVFILHWTLQSQRQYLLLRQSIGLHSGCYKVLGFPKLRISLL